MLVDVGTKKKLLPIKLHSFGRKDIKSNDMGNNYTWEK